MASDVGTLLARLGGGEEEVLNAVPNARGRFIQMGIVLLTTSGLAVVSMSFALHDGLEAALPMAVICGLGWGFVILNLDRLLIQNLDGRSGVWRTIITIAPRLLMAALLGIVISTPLVLRIFHSEIEANTAIVNAQRQGAFGQAVGKSAQAIELENTTKQIAEYEGALKGQIGAIGSPELTLAQNFQKQAQATFDEKQKTSDDTYAKWQCELYGSQCKGASGKHGNGPLARALKREYDQATTALNNARTEVQKADKQVDDARDASNSNSEDALAKAKAQANAALPGLRAKQADLQKQIDAQRGTGSSLINEDTGILSQITSLDQLGKKNHAARNAHWAVAGLFFMIELLPVLVKVMASFGPKSPYERQKETLDDAMLDDNRRQLKDNRRRREAVETDLVDREIDLNRKANKYVAVAMENILDKALADWSQQVHQTLNGAPTILPQHPAAAGSGSNAPTAGATNGHNGATMRPLQHQPSMPLHQNTAATTHVPTKSEGAAGAPPEPLVPAQNTAASGPVDPGRQPITQIDLSGPTPRRKVVKSNFAGLPNGDDL